jgi:hypothetical protein
MLLYICERIAIDGKFKRKSRGESDRAEVDFELLARQLAQDDAKPDQAAD